MNSNFIKITMTCKNSTKKKKKKQKRVPEMLKFMAATQEWKLSPNCMLERNEAFVLA